MTEPLRIARDNALAALDRLAAIMQTESAAGRLSEDDRAQIVQDVNNGFLRVALGK